MNYRDVEYRLDGHVARVTANRPRYRNAQSRRLLEELDAAFARSRRRYERARDRAGRGGRAFFGWARPGIAGRTGRPEAAARWTRGCAAAIAHSREHYVDKTLRWRELPKPTLAAVQGYCIFAGWMVASAMDIIFAADDAMFLPANFQYFSIPWDVHPRRAKELLYESRFIDASEALDLGLVNRVIARAELLDETLDYAHRIAANDPFQLRMIKLAVNQMQDQQGFAAHISSAHALHILSSEGEKDPDYALKVPARPSPPDGRARVRKLRTQEENETLQMCAIWRQLRDACAHVELAVGGHGCSSDP